MPAALDAAARFAVLTEGVGPSSLPPAFRNGPAFRWLTGQHLVVPGPDATSVACTLCRSVHTLERLRDGTYQFVCVDGPEPLKAEQLLRWQTDWPTLCGVFNKAFSPGEPVRTLVSSRLSRVGWSGKPETGFPVWLVRGLSRVSEVQGLITALSADSLNRRGVVVSASQVPQTFKLPAGLSSVWLGHCYNPARGEAALDLSPVLGVGYGESRMVTKKRGRPPKPGDPVQAFIDRVNSGNALKKIGKEAEAIHKLECRKFTDPKLAFETSTIEEKIQKPFNSWKEQGFPRPFSWS
jgi:hypothetical protein